MPRAARPATPPPARTVAGAAYEQLRALIVRGRLPPGARVTETDAAERLRASRTPVREALRRLQQDGLLVATGRDGAGKLRLAVAPVAAAEVRELYHAAGALEGVAAREVTALAAADRRALAERLREAEAAFEAEGRRATPDWDRLFELHDAFHRTVVDALAGPRLRALLDALRPQLDRYEFLYAPLLGPGYDATFAEHAAIVAALAGGSADEAERAVRRNWFDGAARLARRIGRRGGPALLDAPAGGA